jgi:hypothetical protein
VNDTKAAKRLLFMDGGRRKLEQESQDISICRINVLLIIYNTYETICSLSRAHSCEISASVGPGKAHWAIHGSDRRRLSVKPVEE